MISIAVVQKLRFAMQQLLDAKAYCTSSYGNEHIDKAIEACEQSHEMLVGYKHEEEDRV